MVDVVGVMGAMNSPGVTLGPEDALTLVCMCRVNTYVCLACVYTERARKRAFSWSVCAMSVCECVGVLWLPR